MNRIDRFTSLQGLFIEQLFQEALSLKSLGQGAVSNLTATNLDRRLTDPEANSHVALIEAKWKIEDNEVVVFFYVSPTYGGHTVLTPSARPYEGSFYNVVFQFSGVETFLGTIEEFTGKQERDREKSVEQMIWNCPVKVYSNDPSFYYQAAWEDLAKVDGVVFPFPGPTGTGYWHDKHVASGGLANPNIHITKHMANIIQEMPKLIPVITKAMKKVGGPEVAPPKEVTAPAQEPPAPEPTPGVTPPVTPEVVEQPPEGV
jgi:hypothetical protein